MNKIYKIVLLSVLSILLIVAITAQLSPYRNKVGFEYKLIRHTVNIAAPADSVFRYLGNSSNALQWSVFVDHITDLNSGTVLAGTPGIKRRCYCREDETGIQWDETVTIVESYKRRQLTCYDLKGFSMTVDGIATEQLYESFSPTSCNLSFTFFIKDRTPNFFETIKIYIGSFRVNNIFKRNLENIKAICEGHQPLHLKE